MPFQNYTTGEHTEVKSAVIREAGSYAQMYSTGCSTRPWSRIVFFFFLLATFLHWAFRCLSRGGGGGGGVEMATRNGKATELGAKQLGTYSSGGGKALRLRTAYRDTKNFVIL